MATAAKPAPEPKNEPAPEPTGETNDEALTEKITSVVKDVLKDVLPGKSETKSEPEDTGKPMTAREEESRTRNIVQEAIKAFKDEVSSAPKQEEKKEPESVPGARSGRWIEKVLWGKE